jgi:hypothetical protein
MKIEGYIRECYEVEQALGKALGYPYVDHTVCPDCHPVTGCTCGNPEVCVGEHTPSSIAEEAARKIF